jgi:hypothetical protein
MAADHAPDKGAGEEALMKIIARLVVVASLAAIAANVITTFGG